MILLEKTFEIHAALARQTWRYPLVGLVLMVAVSAVLALPASTLQSHRWVVRKGICPCCGSALFGTTTAYQRLPGLDLVYPESPYLCLTCDRAKVAVLQRQAQLERADD